MQTWEPTTWNFYTTQECKRKYRQLEVWGKTEIEGDTVTGIREKIASGYLEVKYL